MFEKQFPVLGRKINGKKLVYLDGAATAQKPQALIDAMVDFYERHNANVHRGIHTLSQEATERYENARVKIQNFLEAQSAEEIIFTKGTTESINFAASTWGSENIHRGDEILLTEMEHHSNIVPWQILARKKHAKLKFIPVSKQGRLELRNLNDLITPKTKLVAFTHASNVSGAINPVVELSKIAHKKGAKVLIDGAQAAGHIKINLQKINCDFYALSGHKMYGPTGIGVLYARKSLLGKLPPYQFGGSMIKTVTLYEAAWNEPPEKFEAGTPNIAGAIGLAAAVDFINSVGIERIADHEARLTAHTLKRLAEIPGLTIYGPRDAKNRIGVISFNLRGVPPHDLASFLDEQGVAIRTGHHCTMPLHQKFGITASARASLGIYNEKKDIDTLVSAIKNAQKLFA